VFEISEDSHIKPEGSQKNQKWAQDLWSLCVTVQVSVLFLFVISQFYCGYYLICTEMKVKKKGTCENERELK
jgi:hypothetical protein